MDADFTAEKVLVHGLSLVAMHIYEDFLLVN